VSSDDTFGPFDAVASLGAFEHFCSPDDYQTQRQERVYRRLFENVSGLLRVGGRFYLQTMVFGANMIDVDASNVDAARHSDAWYLALLGCQFPRLGFTSGVAANQVRFQREPLGQLRVKPRQRPPGGRQQEVRVASAAAFKPPPRDAQQLGSVGHPVCVGRVRKSPGYLDPARLDHP
jgi:hypothetical protein